MRRSSGRATPEESAVMLTRPQTLDLARVSQLKELLGRPIASP
jgi:hypothetical protein